MTLQQKILVMQHFLDGGKVQDKGSWEADKEFNWQDVNKPSWCWDRYSYRIKPEPSEPKLVPFDFSDDLVGRVVKSKVGDVRRLITDQTPEEVFFAKFGYGYITLLDQYTFLDGTPCGKYVNEN